MIGFLLVLEAFELFSPYSLYSSMMLLKSKSFTRIKIEWLGLKEKIKFLNFFWVSF